MRERLLGLFGIDVFVRLRDNTKVRPLTGFGGVGNIEWDAAGKDGDGLVSNWQFDPESGLTWETFNCDFCGGAAEIVGNEDRGLIRLGYCEGTHRRC